MAHPLSAVSIDSLARAAAISLPTGDDDLPLDEPRLPFVEADDLAASESTRDSYVQGTPFDSGTALQVTKNEDYAGEEDSVPLPPKTKRRPLLLIFVGLVALIVLVLVVMLPVYFIVIKSHNASPSKPSSGSQSGSNSTSGGHGGNPPPPSSKDAITGGDGSTVKASDGSTFTYNNKLGGICEFLPS